MESKSYSFRELLSGCKNSNYMHEYVLYFKLCAVGTLFRKGRNFKLKVRREMRLERVPKSGRIVSKTEIPIERRLQMLQEFLKKNGGITRIEYSRLTGVSRLKAVDDLNTFIREGKLRKRGAGRNVFYVWKLEE